MLFWWILPKSTPQITSICRCIKLKRTRVIKYSNCTISSQTSKTNKKTAFILWEETSPLWSSPLQNINSSLTNFKQTQIERHLTECQTTISQNCQNHPEQGKSENVIGQKLWRNYSKVSLWLGQKEDRREEEMNLIKLWNWIRSYPSFSSFWQMYIRN